MWVAEPKQADADLSNIADVMDSSLPSLVFEAWRVIPALQAEVTRRTQENADLFRRLSVQEKANLDSRRSLCDKLAALSARVAELEQQRQAVIALCEEADRAADMSHTRFVGVSVQAPEVVKLLGVVSGGNDGDGSQDA